jgi:lysophospholipase L1-like esterase
MTHVVLLGDSVFDNAAYVSGGPGVIRQVRAIVPDQGWRATLGAVDGAVIASIPAQLAKIPADASHLVVSIGGNDALGASGVIEEGARSVADALLKVAAVAARFRAAYGQMIDAVLARGLPTAVCTIYEPRFPDATRRQAAAAALTALNDAITREAFSRHVTLIDVREIFNHDADFANPIEPSTRGGEKLARAVVAFAAGTGSSSRVIAG